jgi:xylose isomerase
MDAFARGLKIAAAVRADGRLGQFVSERYASWNSGIGQKVENKQVTLADLAEHVAANPEPVIASGRQEMLENILNECVC